ncbi:MAG: RidA family protein [Nitrososphaerales archaeon]
MKKILFSSGLTSSSLYSHGIKVDNTIYLSGIVAFDPITKKVETRSVDEQTEQALRNCEKILLEGGASLKAVVQAIVLLKNSGDFDGMNAAHSAIFSGDSLPARAVTKLGVDVPNIMVSIMMTAVVST